MSAKKKLSALKKAQKKLKVSGDSTSDVQKIVERLVDSFKDYIRSDNLSADDLIRKPMLVNIEGHEDFRTAVRYLNLAIQEAEEEVRQEEEARQREIKEIKNKLLGVM